MQKIRIIPTLLYKEVGLVKGTCFKSDRRVGSVLPAIKVYTMREVDELILLDVVATAEHRHPDFEAIAEYTDDCFVPLTVGGGIRSLEDIKGLLRAGADKVAINTYALECPEIIDRAAAYYGSQCIVVSIDSQRDENGAYYCYSHSGKVKTSRLVQDWAQEAERRGAGEILITAIDHDGMMTGYDMTLVKMVTDHVRIPVIASGGAGNYEDFYQAIAVGNASAVSAASMFHFRQHTPKEAKAYLKSKDIPVRNSSII